MYGTHLEDKKICIEIGVDRKIEDFRQNIYSCSTPVLKNTMILLPTYATVLWIFLSLLAQGFLSFLPFLRAKDIDKKFLKLTLTQKRAPKDQKDSPEG